MISWILYFSKLKSISRIHSPSSWCIDSMYGKFTCEKILGNPREFLNFNWLDTLKNIIKTETFEEHTLHILVHPAAVEAIGCLVHLEFKPIWMVSIPISLCCVLTGVYICHWVSYPTSPSTLWCMVQLDMFFAALLPWFFVLIHVHV